MPKTPLDHILADLRRHREQLERQQNDSSERRTDREEVLRDLEKLRRRITDREKAEKS